MKYSVIIPTMYFHVEQLQEMLTVYNGMKCVGEILIINNNKEQAVDFDLSKVKTIGDGVNKYVNPSWKYGVENAKYENIVIANDDITIRGDLESVLEAISCFLNSRRVFGPSVQCFTEFENGVNPIKFRKQEINKRKITYGFGVFMCMKKSTFTETAIPKDFLIWYGDHILCLRNQSWEFSGVEIKTNMRGTTSKMNLQNFTRIERNAFRRVIV